MISRAWESLIPYLLKYLCSCLLGADLKLGNRFAFA